MKDLTKLNDQWGPFLWAMANRYHTGIDEPDDVYQEVLTDLMKQITEKKIDGHDEATVKSFIITRCINRVRYEKRFISISIHDPDAAEKLLKDQATAPPDKIAEAFEEEILFDFMVERMPLKYALFLRELAFPGSETIKVLNEELIEKHQDYRLRMRVREQYHKHIFPKHAAEALRRLLDVCYSNATISRIRKMARELLVSDLLK